MQTAYNGKVCSFASSVLALTHSTVKGRSRWVQALWLGKGTSSEHLCCTHGSKLLLTRSVRLLNPAYSAALRNVIKDHSQKTQAVTDEGSHPAQGKLGLRILYNQVAEGDHAANGGAESAVHQTRLQAGVLLGMYEARSGCTVTTGVPSRVLAAQSVWHKSVWYHCLRRCHADNVQRQGMLFCVLCASLDTFHSEGPFSLGSGSVAWKGHQL